MSNYPDGAANDPKAPWNQPDEPTQCDVCHDPLEQTPDGITHYRLAEEDDEEHRKPITIAVCLTCDNEFICKDCFGKFDLDEAEDSTAPIPDLICQECFNDASDE